MIAPTRRLRSPCCNRRVDRSSAVSIPSRTIINSTNTKTPHHAAALTLSRVACSMRVPIDFRIVRAVRHM